MIEPQLRGDPKPMPDLTLAELVAVYLERHAASVRPRTIVTLRERLPHATRAFGTVKLRELERMSGEIASWQARLPERSRYGIVQALRQALEAAVRWGYMTRNPAKLAGRNRQPSPRVVRAFTRAEVDAIAAELSPAYAPLPMFAAATGLRPAIEASGGSTHRGCSRHPPVASSTSTTSGAASGLRRSRRAGSRRRHGSTTFARRSRQTRSRQASQCSSWRA
jgi:hypothetical protein